MDDFTVDIAEYLAKTEDGSAFMFSFSVGKSILEQILSYDLEFGL